MGCFGLFEVGYLLDVFVHQGYGNFWKFLTIYSRYFWDVSCRVKYDTYWMFSAVEDTEIFGCL